MMKEIYFKNLDETLINHVLPNGLTINIVPKKDYSKSFALLATNYGGSDTRFKKDGQWLDTPAGIAHFLEHKMFEMASGGNAEERFAQYGASTNAFTSSDMTVYYFECTENFSENLRILLEFVSQPYFTAASVSKEQGIIGQEISMIEDDPGWMSYKNLLECLYRDHPLRVSVAGTKESIAEITHNTLYDCHATFYTPSNMILCIAGDVDPNAVYTMAEEILPKEIMPEIIRDYGANEPAGAMSKKAEAVMEVSMPRFCIGFKLTPVDDGRPRLEMEILGELACQALFGSSSPLYADMYASGLINSAFDGELELYKGAAAVIIGGESRDSGAVYDRILGEAGRIAAQGLDEGLFNRLKKAALGDRIKALGSFEAVCIHMAEAHFGKCSYFEFLEAFDAATPERARLFIKENIVSDRGAISLINGKQGSK